MTGMIRFEWDEAKAESNLRKHGIDFDDAIEVFYDPHAMCEQNRVVDGELRWQTIGMVGDVVVLQVAHTVTEQNFDEVIRIISARRATRKERRRYGQNYTKSLG
jgi:hypothetical protein